MACIRVCLIFFWHTPLRSLLSILCYSSAICTASPWARYGYAEDCGSHFHGVCLSNSGALQHLVCYHNKFGPWLRWLPYQTSSQLDFWYCLHFAYYRGFFYAHLMNITSTRKSLGYNFHKSLDAIHIRTQTAHRGSTPFLVYNSLVVLRRAFYIICLCLNLLPIQEGDGLFGKVPTISHPIVPTLTYLILNHLRS